MMLEINGLVKKYKDFILNCTMKVERGCITGLVGENGAGKSTYHGACRRKRGWKEHDI